MEVGYQRVALPQLLPVLCMFPFLRKAATYSRYDWITCIATCRHDLTFVCLGCATCLCPAYKRVVSLLIIFYLIIFLSSIVLPPSFLTSPPVFVSSWNIINNHLASPRLVTKMSMTIGKVEVLWQTSSGKHLSNNVSIFLWLYFETWYFKC